MDRYSSSNQLGKIKLNLVIITTMSKVAKYGNNRLTFPLLKTFFLFVSGVVATAITFGGFYLSDMGILLPWSLNADIRRSMTAVHNI